MAHLDIDTTLAWRERTVLDSDGEKIGTFGDVFLDRETNLPAWGGVRTGLFGRHESYVPLDRIEEDGEDLRVPYPAQLVKDAPRIDPQVALTAAEEEKLYEHFGQSYAPPGAGEEEARAAHRDEAHGERPPAGDGAMTRSEEEVSVERGPMRPAERVRLRKVLVTEQRKETVPVRREVVQLEHEPPPEGHVEHVEDAGEHPREERG